MARYNRINLDGKSVTESRKSDAEVLPGTLQVITGDKFVAPAADAVQKLYVANAGHLQGLGTDDAIPAGDTIEGEYLETGREVAALLTTAVTVVKDSPLAVAATGQLVLASSALESPVVAYAQEALTAGDTAELLWVRGA